MWLTEKNHKRLEKIAVPTGWQSAKVTKLWPGRFRKDMNMIFLIFITNNLTLINSYSWGPLCCIICLKKLKISSGSKSCPRPKKYLRVQFLLFQKKLVILHFGTTILLKGIIGLLPQIIFLLYLAQCRHSQIFSTPALIR